MKEKYISIKQKITEVGLIKTIFYIIRTVIDPYYRIFYLEPVRKSFSQKYEDIIVDRLLNFPKKGFYMDIGANDYKKLNNTKKFYDRGWSGINIEPNYFKFKDLEKNRGRDINLNIGLSDKREDLKFYIIKPDTLSTFAKEQAGICEMQGNKIESVKQIPCYTLEEIFKKYVKCSVNFLSIDTEGWDLKILKSNNWKIFRPKIVIIEAEKPLLRKEDNTLISKEESFLNSVGYEKNIQTIHFGKILNSIYVDKFYFKI